MFAERSTCQFTGPARAATVALLLAVAALPRACFAAETSTGKAPPPQTALIDQHIRRQWLAGGVVPSTPAEDGEWCRRVYLDVVGRIPTVEELVRFLDDPSARRKALLVDRLLGEPYAEQYARNWTTLWANVLVGRQDGNDRRSLVNRAGLEQSLLTALAENWPYDRLAFELIAAKGVNKPGEADFNGFVNFLADKLGDRAAQATARTAQVFLGLQVQCTQCHNHPFNEWKQNQFWELNAFFRQAAALRRYEDRDYIKSVELVNQDFAGEDANVDEAVVFYELRNGLKKAAFPVFVDGTSLKSKSGYLDQVDRRTELARLCQQSEYLAPAIVNRLWGHFLGYGFTRPVDDMGPHNPPTHPELLAALAAEFKAHGHDLKQLIRWIVLSEAYGLSSRANAKNKRDDPALGSRPLFSHFYLRQMRLEELYESLLVATEAQNTEKTRAQRESTKSAWLEQFTVAFGTDDNEQSTTFNGTIPQTLMMMNGELVEKATSVAQGSFLHRVATNDKLNNAAKIQHLYLAALSRRPTTPEVALANELFRWHQGDAVAALQDVWWAVLNTNEFILNH